MAKIFEKSVYSGKRRNMHTFFGIVIIAMALLTAVVSFAILLGFTPVIPSTFVTLILIGVNSVWVLGLIAITVYEMMPIVKAWRARTAASRLHIRIISLFAMVATLPAVVVVIVAGVKVN